MTSPSKVENREAEAVYSKLADDPDLRDLVVAFVGEIPTRVAALLDCLAEGDWETLSRLTHQFKSAVGSYGFDELVPIASRLDLAVRGRYPEDAIRRAVMELVATCRRVRAGSPSRQPVGPYTRRLEKREGDDRS